MPYQRSIPSFTDLKRLSVFGSMGMICWQSGSFAKALLIQLTKATFSSSVGQFYREDHKQQKRQAQITKGNCAQPRPIKITSFIQLIASNGIMLWLRFQ